MAAAVATLGTVLWFVGEPGSSRMARTSTDSSPKNDAAVLKRVSALEARLDEVEANLRLLPSYYQAKVGDQSSPREDEEDPNFVWENYENKISDDATGVQFSSHRMGFARNDGDRKIRLLEAHFVGEEIDDNWSSNFLSLLDSDLNLGHLGDARLSSAECRTSLCKVVIDYDNEESERKFADNMLDASFLKNRHIHYRREEEIDASVSLTLYVAREGQGLFDNLRLYSQ